MGSLQVGAADVEPEHGTGHGWSSFVRQPFPGAGFHSAARRARSPAPGRTSVSTGPVPVVAVLPGPGRRPERPSTARRGRTTAPAAWWHTAARIRAAYPTSATPT